MKSLYVRIWLTVVAVLALFALGSGWLLQRHLQEERAEAKALLAERMAGWAELIQNSLPDRTSPMSDQARALQDWSNKLGVPLALTDSRGGRIAESDSYSRWILEGRGRGTLPLQLDDGRKLWMMRPPLRAFRSTMRAEGIDPTVSAGPRWDGFGAGDGGLPPPLMPGPGNFEGSGPRPGNPAWPAFPPFLGQALVGEAGDVPAGLGLALLLGMLFVAVAAGAFPVVRRLTRRLEALQDGVEAFGAGALDCRVNESGRDEVAAVAASFNRAATRIQALIMANQNLLANASHELRSPLARLKMAVTMLEDATEAAAGAAPARREALRREIHVNIAELDALVEEVLLSSRLESGAPVALQETVDLLGLLAEECSRSGATLELCEEDVRVTGSDRLLRRAVRNLLENARRYGGGEVCVSLRSVPGGEAEIDVADRGPGVPESERERIFEPFYRLEGHAEREGGVGLGLALVRQIVRRHLGSVTCSAREGGGSVFRIRLPHASLSTEALETNRLAFSG